MDDLEQGLDRHSRLPLYVQVKDRLQERIHSGALRPGDKLPSESELCAAYAVSRPVVRQALAELVNEGLVVRKQGRGSFVAPPKISEALVQRLTGFYQDMAERGMHPVSRVLRQEITPASAALARHLDVPAGTDLIAIDRVRLVQGEPLVHVNTYIPYRLCPGLLGTDLRYRSLYEVLEGAGLVISRGRRWIEAVAATARQAALLAVPKGAPLIRLESVSFLADGTPVEFYDAIHRSDRARFEVDLVRLIDPWERKEGAPANVEAERTAAGSGGVRASAGLLMPTPGRSG